MQPRANVLESVEFKHRVIGPGGEVEAQPVPYDFSLSFNSLLVRAGDDEPGPMDVDVLSARTAGFLGSRLAMLGLMTWEMYSGELITW